MSEARSLLLIEPEANVLAFLAGQIRQAGYNVLTAASGKEGLIEAWRNRPEVIVIDLDVSDVNGLEMVRKLRADHRTGPSKILLLSVRANPEDIQAGLQAGADHYLVKRSGADVELMEYLAGLFQAVEAAPAAMEAPSGKLISFLSAKGGTGTSSLCANMAQTLTGLVAPQTVAVVDLVLPIGSIGQIVGVDSPDTVVTASRLEPGRLTVETLQTMASHVPEWGFHLLPGAPDPEIAQALDVGRLEALFDTLRRAFDYVLIDFGRSLSRISLPLIRASSRIVLIFTPDRSAVSLTKTTLKYLELQGVRRSQIYPILNRPVGLEGMTKADIEQELGLAIPGILPYLSGSLTLANSLHEALARKFPNDSATLALHGLTAGMLRQIEEQPGPVNPRF